MCSPVSAKAVCVNPKQVDLIWPRVEGLLIYAVSQGSDVSLDDIKRGLKSGSMLLWIAAEESEILACVVTSLIVGTNPPEKRCEVMTIGGYQLPKWIHLISEIEKYAIAEGCAAFRVTSRRRAWVRLLSDFKEPFVILEKRL